VTGPTRWIESQERHETRDGGTPAPWDIHPSRHLLERLAPLFGAFAVAIGTLALLGWWAGISALTTVFPGLAAMQANTALAIVLSGAALVLLAGREASKQKIIAGSVCAAIVAVLGTVSGIEHLTGQDLGIDRLLVPHPGSGSGAPGRMAPGSAAGFVMIGAGLLLIDTRLLWLRVVADTATLLAGSIGLAMLLVHTFGAASEADFSPYTDMAVHTAAALALLAAALMFARPERGAMSRVTGATIGSAVVRQVMPVAILGPVLLGSLTLLGERLDLYSLQVGLVLYTIALISSRSILVWLLGGIIDRADNGRRRADELHRLVLYDDLSGLFNRRYLDHVLEEECRRAVRYGCGISCVMIDIDGLRQVNKRLGLPVGDWLIRQVAHVIRSLAREADIAARFGAGEFFLVLPETDQAGAIILSERLRDAVEARRFGAGQLPEAITISLGIFTPTEVSDIEPAALIRNADASLRQAKAQGRNQILAI